MIGNSTLLQAGILVILIAYGIASWHFRLSSRLNITTGLLLLAMTAIAVAAGQENFGNFLATLAYYLLAIGVVLAIREYRGKLQKVVGTQSNVRLCPPNARDLSSKRSGRRQTCKPLRRLLRR